MPTPRPTLQQALSQQRIPGLDALRAMAVMLVLLDHSGLAVISGISLFNGGIGVELFFVLSGFLITWMLLAESDRHGHIDFIGFYRRRAARLLPAFYGYLLLGLVYLSARGIAIPWDAVLSSAFYVINYYQGLTDAPSHYLSHCWSLAVEEQFYLLWPVLLVALMKAGNEVLARRLTMIILAVWLYRATMALYVELPDAYLYRALEMRADHLAMGGLLAVLLRIPKWTERLDVLAGKSGMLSALLIFLVISATAQQDIRYKYSLGYAIEPIALALLIVVTVMQANRTTLLGACLRNRWITRVGEISYGIYLLHPIVIHPSRKLVEKFTGSFSLGVIVSILVLIVIAELSFRHIESPLREKLRGRTKPAPAQLA